MKFSLEAQAVKLSFDAPISEFRALVCRALGCHNKPTNNGESFFHLQRVGEDEPIPKEHMSRITIPGGPIAPGFRRKFKVSYDKPVDLMDNGTYLSTEAVEGDSTITIQEANAQDATIYVNGDGSAGDKVNSLRVDGHVGPGDFPIVVELAFTVGSNDATAIAVVPAGEPDEPIPG